VCVVCIFVCVCVCACVCVCVCVCVRVCVREKEREIERARENMLVIIAIYVKRKDLVRWQSAFINIYLAVKTLSSFPLTEKEKKKRNRKNINVPTQ